MNQIILALSGRKCAGKNEVAKSIKEFFLSRGKSVSVCSFADTLKEFCIETLGLSCEQCYGTDEQKNSPTEYLWENVGDSFLRWKFAGKKWELAGTSGGIMASTCHFSPLRDTFLPPEIETREQFYKALGQDWWCPTLRSGPMTGREIMQLFGTNLIRETFGNVWAQATIKRISQTWCGPNSDLVEVSIITDNRFPNEVKTVLEQPLGFVIRLTRAPCAEDEHPSEASLDDFDWNRDKCFVLDNAEMSLEEQRRLVVPILEKIQEVSNVVS